jgi:hypothetical protein
MSYINDFTDELSGVMFTTLHRIIIMCNLDNSLLLFRCTCTNAFLSHEKKDDHDS